MEHLRRLGARTVDWRTTVINGRRFLRLGLVSISGPWLMALQRPYAAIGPKRSSTSRRTHARTRRYGWP